MLLGSRAGSSARGEDLNVSLSIDLDDLQSRDGGSNRILPSEPDRIPLMGVDLWKRGHGENSTFFVPFPDDPAKYSAEEDGDWFGVSRRICSANLAK